MLLSHLSLHCTIKALKYVTYDNFFKLKMLPDKLVHQVTVFIIPFAIIQHL